MNICIAGPNRRAGHATDYLTHFKLNSAQNLLPYFVVYIWFPDGPSPDIGRIFPFFPLCTKKQDAFEIQIRTFIVLNAV